MVPQNPKLHLTFSQETVDRYKRLQKQGYAPRQRIIALVDEMWEEFLSSLYEDIEAGEQLKKEE